MAYVITTGYTYGTIDGVAHTQEVNLNGNWSPWGSYLSSTIFYMSMQIGGTAYPNNSSSSTTADNPGNYSILTNGATSYPAKRTLDTATTFRAYVRHGGDGTTKTGSYVTFTAQAIDATSSTPTSSAVTAVTATIACDFYPNINESSATVALEYKKVADSTWTTAGATMAASNGASGYTQQSISRNITGLDGSTTYQFRLSMTRTTVNATSFTSATASFTTEAPGPVATTGSATSIASSSATLNGTVNPHGVSTTYYFEYGTTTGYGSTTAAQGPDSGTSDVPYSQGITGLSPSTTYHFRAVATTGPSNGADAQFDTPADPSAEAILEDHMHIYEYDGKYGVQSTFLFTLSSPSATSSDRLVTTAPASLFAAGDIKVSIDGGAFANATNTPTQIAASNPLYSIVLTAAEMTGTQIIVQFVDQNGPAFRDAFLHVRTKQQLGQIDVDATQIGSNTPAMTLTGVGTSPGFLATGGATSQGDIGGALVSHMLHRGTAAAGAASTITLASTANTTDDYYNGSVITIVGGTGVGQSRVITDYTGSTKVADVNRAWVTQPTNSSVYSIICGQDVWNLPLAELASLPAAAGNAGLKLQALFQRFAFKIDQTATLQQWYKSDSSTVLVSRTVSDNGTTQVIGKLT